MDDRYGGHGVGRRRRESGSVVAGLQRQAKFHARMESTYEEKWREGIARMEKSAKMVDKLERQLQLPPDVHLGSFRDHVERSS